MKKALLTDRWDPHSRERDRQESGQHTHELVAVKPCEGNNSGEKEQQILGSEGWKPTQAEECRVGLSEKEIFEWSY